MTSTQALGFTVWIFALAIIIAYFVPIHAFCAMDIIVGLGGIICYVAAGNIISRSRRTIQRTESLQKKHRS